MQARLVAALRRHGPAGLPGAAVRRVAANARGRLEATAERAFDRRRRIETTGVIQLHTSGTTTRYEPVRPAAFRDFMRHVPLDPGGMTFLDCGSGRGRALFLAIEHGFGTAVGVEIEPAHHQAAVANRSRYRGHGERIQLVHGDARDVPIPGGPVVIFLYNPFPRAVMVDVAAKIGASLRAQPRPAWVIYEAPVDRDLFDAEPLLELIAARTERAGASPRRPRYAVYATRAR